jgi:uncharacterized repeat protein (TIGR01451 family)
LLVAAVLAAGPGCAYNPGYFPWLIPGGHIKQEHAKPGGLGYFNNFDPKACKLDVTPQNATAPLGSQIVLVATVYDKDGQPRRSRRVEWVLEGPGNIIEADESGFYPGRGYKVDNKYAVTYTSYRTKTITRGNDDPKDDTTICPGQTFCVISSAVPGETTVTAYAPEVFNWDAGRVVVKVCWGDGRFAFPPPAVVRSGGEHALTTTVTKFDQDGPTPPNYRVRYRVLDTLDGAPAVLVGRGPGGSAAEAEADLDASGAATVVLRQQDPRAGRTRVAVEVVKPSENGVGPGTVVGRKETVIEWASPQVQLAVRAPAAAGLNASVPVAVAVTNPGSVESGPVRVRVGLSDGATLERSEPPPVRQDAGGFIFDLPAAGAGKRQEVALSVKPAKLGPVAVRAEAVTADNVRAETQAVIRVEAGRLHLVLEAPPTALSAERIAARVAVTNAGASPAASVAVWVPLDPALAHASGQNPVQLAVGTLAVGETRTLELPLTAKGTGRYSLRATATADGDVNAAAEAVTVDVRRAELSAAVTGPKLAYLDQDFTWTVAVGNSGDAAVSGVVVRASLPPEVRVKEASDGGRANSGSVEWTLAELRPGDQKVLKLTASGAKLADRAAVSVIAFGDALSGRGDAARTVGDPVQAKAEAAVAVIGTPAVVMELVTPPGPVELGKKVSFRVRVHNRGTVSARGVEVTALAPAELKAVRGSGQSEGRVEGGKVTFAAVEELRPGESAVFVVETEAAAVGDARFRAEVRAGHLNNPLREEQSVRVVGGR